MRPSPLLVRAHPLFNRRLRAPFPSPVRFVISHPLGSIESPPPRWRGNPTLSARQLSPIAHGISLSSIVHDLPPQSHVHRLISSCECVTKLLPCRTVNLRICIVGLDFRLRGTRLYGGLCMITQDGLGCGMLVDVMWTRKICKYYGIAGLDSSLEPDSDIADLAEIQDADNFQH